MLNTIQVTNKKKQTYLFMDLSARPLRIITAVNKFTPIASTINSFLTNSSNLFIQKGNT